jgi:hypothetical protein
MNADHAFRRVVASTKVRDAGPKLRRSCEARGLHSADFHPYIGDPPYFFTGMANFGALFVGLWSGGAEP